MLKNHRSTFVLALLFGFGALANAAAAADTAAPKGNADIEARFKTADKNHDGCLTLEEAKEGMPRIAKGFDRIDTAKKGCITVVQIQEFAAKQ